MKFYGRENEIAELKRIALLSESEYSRMTVITGRRRIGKTSLIMKALDGECVVYLFVGRKNEATLCAEFITIIASTLDVYVPEDIKTFRSLFQFLMEIGSRQSFHLVIDEFQEFFRINPSIYSDIQNLWDQYRKKSHINFVVSGSIYSLMHRIFEDAEEALFGRADNIMKLNPFPLTIIKEIMKDLYPAYSNDDLLAMYTFTGGVPKYVELLCDGQTLKKERMIDFIVRENSPFVDEGKNLLVEEFGKNYATYFSILSAISSGINTQSEIETAIGDKSIGGQIRRLIDDYNVISRHRPIGSKEGTHAVRYEIIDQFTRFWFNYFDRYRSLIEIKNFHALRKIVKENYTTYSGIILEQYFRQQLSESLLYLEIGSWWELKGAQNEIDIVAICVEKNKALAVEVKRNKKNFRRDNFIEKVKHLEDKVLSGYEIEIRCLSLDDM
jgi:AAA+ ATPase superfamily predicted ATPase